jgi:hypothetical protein
VRGGSGLRVGRTKDADVGEGFRQVKYWVPWWEPECFPRTGSSYAEPEAGRTLDGAMVADGAEVGGVGKALSYVDFGGHD